MVPFLFFRAKKMALFLFFFFFFFFFEIFSLAISSPLDDDLQVLLSFKKISDPANSLSTWTQTQTRDPCCSWRGLTCSQGRVTRLVLENHSLSGPASPGLGLLTQLDQLRVLSLKSNRLSGPIPDLSPLSSLKLLFLSSNNLTGPVPPSIANLTRLYRLDLSHNNLTGPIPANYINALTRILTLRLDSNSLSGPISGFNLPNLQDLNLSSNSLSGSIPPSLSSFPAAAFADNARLCGVPLSSCKDVEASAPGSKPESATAEARRGGKRKGMSLVAVIAIVAGDFLLLLLVSGILFCYFWKKFASSNRSKSSHLQQGEKIVYSSCPYAAAAAATPSNGVGFDKGKIVFLEGGRERGFQLEDLLRASAEMLGKGGYGTAYRAVLEDGSAVAVKRLRQVHIGKREFDSQMELHGKLCHPNLVPLKAYYYARDEKLLVYDYMPGGSLFSLLHGSRGPGRAPLDWNSRMQIAAGAARGLAYVHHAIRGTKLAHGNVKSTNILIDKAGNPRLADFGLAVLVPVQHSLTDGYRAPECPLGLRRAWSSQKADVYAFGIVLLEILTGKSALEGEVNLPRWVQSVVREEWTAEVFDLELMRYKGIEEEMVAMLQIAMSCVAVVPDQRPKIGHVVSAIEELRGGDSPSHESSDSVSASPSSDDARTIGSQ